MVDEEFLNRLDVKFMVLQVERASEACELSSLKAASDLMHLEPASSNLNCREREASFDRERDRNCAADLPNNDFLKNYFTQSNSLNMEIPRAAGRKIPSTASSTVNGVCGWKEMF